MKTRNLKTKTLSILIAMVMLLSMLPMSALAVGEYTLSEDGTLTITGGTAGTDYTYENGVLDIKAAGTYEIKNANPARATGDIIKVSAPSGTVNITLSGVKIDVYNSDSKAAFEITGECTTKLILKDGCMNKFDSASDRAGIANHLHPLIIACENAESVTHICSYDCGWLIANTYNGPGSRSSYGAGIGGDRNENGENITITGGSIAAGNVGAAGAGIGGGWKGDGNNITITGGIVAAMGNDVGISGNNITITGGQVHGSTLSHGEGISGNNIKIVPAENTIIYAYNAHNSDDSEAALVGSPFTRETDITDFVEGGAFFCYAEHVHSFSTDWTYDESSHWHAPTCGHNEEISFKIAHSYSTEWKSDGTNHWNECECGAKIYETAHSGGTATCEDKAVCSVCKVAYGELAAHTYGTEWKSDGTNHWRECECGAKSDEAAHGGGTATCKDKAVCSNCSTVYGELAAHNYKDTKCTICEVVNPNYVPETDSHQTGDNSHMALWIVLLLLSGGAVITLTVYDRKRRIAANR